LWYLFELYGEESSGDQLAHAHDYLKENRWGERMPYRIIL